MLHTPGKDKDIRVVFVLNTRYGMMIPTYQGIHCTTRPLLFLLADQIGCQALQLSRTMEKQPVGLYYCDRKKESRSDVGYFTPR